VDRSSRCSTKARGMRTASSISTVFNRVTVSAAMPLGQQPNPGGELGWHVHHRSTPCPWRPVSPRSCPPICGTGGAWWGLLVHCGSLLWCGADDGMALAWSPRWSVVTVLRCWWCRRGGSGGTRPPRHPSDQPCSQLSVWYSRDLPRAHEFYVWWPVDHSELSAGFLELLF
jgi:hypothetical protein